MKKTYLLIILCIILSTGVSATTVCYQESANTTNQTGIDENCGLDYSGSYGKGGNWYDITGNKYIHVMDGDWTLGGAANLTPSTATADINITYVKPTNALSTSKWKVKYSNTGPFTTYYSIPSDCWNSNTTHLKLYFISYRTNTTGQMFCYNTSTTMRQIAAPASNSLKILEEAMEWQISQTAETANTNSPTNNSLTQNTTTITFNCTTNNGAKTTLELWDTNTNDELISYWDFEETYGDTIKDRENNNNGTISTYRFAERQDGELYFTGTTGTARAVTLTSCGLGTEYSVCFGIKNVSTAAYHATDARQYILSSTGSLEAGGAYYQANSGTMKFGLKNSSGSVYEFRVYKNLTNTNIEAHYCFTISTTNNNITGYLNGTLSNTSTMGTFTTTMSVDTIGHRYDAGLGLNGTLTEMMIYSKTLTPTEVSTIYNNYAQGRGAITQYANTTSTNTDHTYTRNLNKGYYNWRCGIRDETENLTYTTTQNLTITDMTATLNNPTNTSTSRDPRTKINCTTNNGARTNIQAWNTTTTEGLRTYWDFEEQTGTKLKDFTGTFNGTAYNTPTPNTTTTTGTGWHFARSSSEYVNVTDSKTVLPTAANGFTILTTAIVDNYNSGTYMGLVNIRNSTANNQSGNVASLMYNGVSPKYYFVIYNTTPDAAGANTLTGATYTSGVLVHLAATFDGTTMKLYDNGTLSNSMTLIGSPRGIGNAELTIGRAAGNYFNGTIDEVAIYNRSLTQEEITEIQKNYENGLGLITRYSNSTATNGDYTYNERLNNGDNYWKCLVRDENDNIISTQTNTYNQKCAYTTGNWNMNCADNCTINTQIDTEENNITMNGEGHITITANIINWIKTTITGTNNTNKCTVTCNGGCLQK